GPSGWLLEDVPAGASSGRRDFRLRPGVYAAENYPGKPAEASINWQYPEHERGSQFVGTVRIKLPRGHAPARAIGGRLLRSAEVPSRGILDSAGGRHRGEHAGRDVVVADRARNPAGKAGEGTGGGAEIRRPGARLLVGARHRRSVVRCGRL